MKILLVDKHVLFREGLASLLESEDDLTVVGEADVAENAVEKARHLKPDLVLIDVSLPDGKGLDALHHIAENDPDCAVILLTTEVSEELLIRVVRLGAKGYLLKTTPFDKLVASIRGVMRGEAAISRTMAGRLVEELHRQSSMTNGDRGELDTLTSREMEVLRILCSGASNKEIAHRLSITENTVKVHVSNILSKLEMDNRQEVARLVTRRGYFNYYFLPGIDE